MYRKVKITEINYTVNFFRLFSVIFCFEKKSSEIEGVKLLYFLGVNIFPNDSRFGYP